MRRCRLMSLSKMIKDDGPGSQIEPGIAEDSPGGLRHPRGNCGAKKNANERPFRPGFLPEVAESLRDQSLR